MAQEIPVDALIATLHAQRASLGDAAVDFAIAAIQHKLQAERQASAAPRLRQVSVLFCDIVDSTALLQPLAAEDALAVVAAPLQRFVELVEAAGGRVLRFTGDGLKAAFGMDQAREDDAERAVDTGLAMLAAARVHALQVQQSLGLQGFAVRVGINSGPVVLGGGVESDNSAMGHAVHIAARLEQAAPPGRLLIAQSTRELVRGRFALRAQPPLQVKGSTEPLLTWLVDAALPRTERTVQRGLDGVATPLVGRGDELACLHEAVRRAAESRQQQAITLLADAGVGKSRLAQALQQQLAEAGTPHQIWLARAQPASRLQTYGLLRDLLARRCALADDEGADSARHKLVQTLAPLIGERGELQARVLGRLIGLHFPGHPEVEAFRGSELRDRAWRALRRVLAGAARQAPLVLLLDDLHWADDASLELLEDLIAKPLAEPVALLGLARPALLEQRAAWPADGDNHSRITLPPLTQADGHALAAALLQHLPEPPAALTQLLVQRAGGNPFYMEELLRMLIDDGVIDVRDRSVWQLQPGRLDHLRLPATLIGVLQARLDALPQAARLALQQASIIGPVFWTDALAALEPQAPEALPLLAERRLLAANHSSAFEGSREYAFHHALLHEVTYGTVLKAQRREGHARSARWLAERVGERGSEFVAVTADHFEKAGDSASALAYFERAAHEAFARDARSAADAYYERALAQPALTDPRQRFALLDSRWATVDSLGRAAQAQALLDEQQALAEAHDDDAMRADAASNRALQADRLGDEALAAAEAQRAVTFGERSGRARAAALGHGELAWLAVGRGDHEAAQHHLEPGLAWARRVEPTPRTPGGRHTYEKMLRVVAVESLITQGRLLEAAAELDRLLAAPEGHDSLGLCGLLERQGMVARDLGDVDAAKSVNQRMLAHATEAELPRGQAAALTDLALLALVQHEPAAASAHLARAEALAQATGDAMGLARVREGQGRLLRQQGQHSEALAPLAEAQRLYEGVGHALMAGQALAHAADSRRLAGDHAAALASVERLLGQPELSGEARLLCWRVLAALQDERADALASRLQADLRRQLQALPEPVHARLLQHVPLWHEVAAMTIAPVAAHG